MVVTSRMVCLFSGAVLWAASVGCGPNTGGTASVAAAAEPAASKAPSPCAGSLPSPSLAPPAGNELAFHLRGVGVQIYTCSANPSGAAAWGLTAPEANLYDARGALAGTHYAGPTWESKDGSKVVGTRLAAASPDPTAIPWLLLGAASHSGDGRMEEVTYIQRLHTIGGLAPTDGCDADHLGAVARVSYEADYCFYEAQDD
jgi:hypothetical protein